MSIHIASDRNNAADSLGNPRNRRVTGHGALQTHQADKNSVSLKCTSTIRCHRTNKSLAQLAEVDYAHVFLCRSKNRHYCRLLSAAVLAPSQEFLKFYPRVSYRNGARPHRHPCGFWHADAMSVPMRPRARIDSTAMPRCCTDDKCCGTH